jgi:hypothetical protein
MHFWIVKGRPSRNDLDTMLVPGRAERWVTRKPPNEWEPGDGIFFWKSAPALRLVGLGRLKTTAERNASGDAHFVLTYLTSTLESPLGIDELRRDRIIGDASFLKVGPAGTVFPISGRQADRLLELIRGRNPVIPTHPWTHPGKAASLPEMALSIRQPWAELIMRGVKTIEVRSLRTHKRARVQIYASKGGVSLASRERIEKEHGVDIKALPRGVLVGTVEIVGCRPLAATARRPPLVSRRVNRGLHGCLRRRADRQSSSSLEINRNPRSFGHSDSTMRPIDLASEIAAA